jgi:hypothetical protein
MHVRSGRALCFPDCSNLYLAFGMGNTILGPDGMGSLAWLTRHGLMVTRHGTRKRGSRHSAWLTQGYMDPDGMGSLVGRGDSTVGMAHSRWENSYLAWEIHTIVAGSLK